MKKKKISGFTLIELLVVIAIIALLLSIILPGIKAAKDYAKRIVCASRLKGTGAALKLYSDANKELLPSDKDNKGNREPHTYTAYRGDKPDLFQLPNGKLRPFRFAYLYEQNYVDVPEIFYCPGNNPNQTPQYVYENYIHPAPWGRADQEFNISSGSNLWVRTGLTYYPVEINAKINSSTYAPAELATKYITLNPNMPYASDIVHNRYSISHQRTDRYMLNCLYGDGHVSTCSDQAVFNNLCDPSGRDIWKTLDSGDMSDTSFYHTAVYAVYRAVGP